MPLRDIVTLGSPVDAVLRRRAHKVVAFDDKLHRILDDMVETLIAAPGVGLAAPQVNVSQRIIVVRLPDDDEARKEYGDQAGVLYEVINPEIARVSDELVEGVEACLSIPGYVGSVDRHVEITVKGQDRTGKKIRIKAADWLARVFQHEIDHLDGVLFLDRASDVWQSNLSEQDVEGPPRAKAPDPR